MNELNITAVEAGARHVVCRLSDETKLVRSYVWLRDHARDSASFDANTHQRTYETAKMDLDIKPDSIGVAANPCELEVRWPDHDSVVLYTLDELSGEKSTFTSVDEQVSWRVAPNSTLLYEQAIDSSDGLLLENLSRHGYVHVKGCPVTPNSVEHVANRIGYVRQTHYGGIWHFEADQAMADSAYSTDALRPHTDGTYYHDAPGLQLLMCIEERAEGGESLLVDGLAVLEDMQIDCPQVLEALRRINVTGIYKGDGRVMRATRPMVRMNGDQIEQISYNNYDRDRLALSDDDENMLYQGIAEFESRANLVERQWLVKLKPGELIIFDNWRILHGRQSFTGHRKMSGCYINRDEYLSCLNRSR